MVLLERANPWRCLTKKICIEWKNLWTLCRHLAKDTSKSQIIEGEEENVPDDQSSVHKYTLYRRNLQSDFLYFKRFNKPDSIIIITVLANVYVCMHVCTYVCMYVLIDWGLLFWHWDNIEKRKLRFHPCWTPSWLFQGWATGNKQAASSYNTVFAGETWVNYTSKNSTPSWPLMLFTLLEIATNLDLFPWQPREGRFCKWDRLCRKGICWGHADLRAPSVLQISATNISGWHPVWAHILR